MIITKTPLRISFGGGGTDIASAVDAMGEPGAVVNLAINKYVYVYLKPHSPVFAEKYRLNYSSTENVNSRSLIKNRIIKACLEFMGIDERLYIGSSADLPAGTGLGSSSAFTVGLLHALHIYLENKSPSSIQLAREAVRIEVDILKNPIGIQDQFGCALGGLKHFYIKKNNEFELIKNYKTEKYLEWITNRIFLAWTDNVRDANDILADQQNRAHQNIDNLLAIKQDSFEFMDSFEASDSDQISKILIKGWLSKKKLSPHIFNEKIDNVANKIENCGIYSYRLLGAGGGGFVLGWGDQAKTNIQQDADLNITHVEPDCVGTRGSVIE